MTDKKHRTASPTDRRPDCVTETRMGNTVLIVSGFFKKGGMRKAVMPGSMTAGMGVIITPLFHLLSDLANC